MLLAIDVTQWVIFGIILVLIIAYPVVAMITNKKNNEKAKTMGDNLKKGDKILTGTGIVGKIVEIELQADGTKAVTVETGTSKNKGFITVDARAIYQVLPSDKELAEMAKAEELAKAEAAKEQAAESKDVVVEKPAEKKPTAKTATTAKSPAKATESKTAATKTATKKPAGNSAKKSK